MREENNNYFKKALSDFAYDMACGAQIRHLADLGYTINQILEALDISVPYERVQKTLNEHLQKTGVLLIRKPDHIIPAKKAFVKEYDSYGRASFRQIVVQETKTPAVHWQEHAYKQEYDGNLLHFLEYKTKENGVEASYISCDFGLDRKKTEECFRVLGQRQQEYLRGILWEKKRMYHSLTPRMREIIARLYVHGLYGGEGYFQTTGEHILFGTPINLS